MPVPVQSWLSRTPCPQACRGGGDVTIDDEAIIRFVVVVVVSAGDEAVVATGVMGDRDG